MHVAFTDYFPLTCFIHFGMSIFKEWGRQKRLKQ